MENQSPVLKASSKSKLNVEKGESDLDYGSEMTNHMLDLQKSSPLKQSREAEVQLMQLDPAEVIKLQKHNEMLREQLKQMSQQLTQMIGRKQSRAVLKSPTVQELGKEELKKELENAQKQLQIYAKTVKQLQMKLELSTNNNRLQELEVLLQTKEQEIARLVQEKKAFEKISRTQEKALGHHSIESSITANYMSEVKTLRQRVRDLEDKEKQHEKASMKKHEYYLKIEEKFREKPHNANDFLTPKITKSDTTWKKDLNRTGNGINEQYFKGRSHSKPVLEGLPQGDNGMDEKEKEYQASLTILKKAIVSNEKKFKGEKDQLQSQIQILNEKNKELMTKLKDKERENNILTSQLSEVKRLLRAQVEEQKSPMSKKVIPKKPDIFREEIENKSLVRPKKQEAIGMSGMRMEEVGKATKNTEAFSDQELFTNKKDWRITGVTVWMNKKAVSGLMARYRDSNGETIQGNMHGISAVQHSDNGQEIKFQAGDYLKNISGFLDKSETYIQVLKFITAKGETHEVGKVGNTSKPFEFDINEYEYPAVIFGGLEIEYREEEDGTKTEIGANLVKFGVLIKSNAVEENIEQPEDRKKKAASRVQ